MRGHGAIVKLSSRMDLVPSGVYSLESVSTKTGKNGYSKLNIKNVHTKTIYSLDKEYEAYLVLEFTGKIGTGARLSNLPDFEGVTVRDNAEVQKPAKETPYSNSSSFNKTIVQNVVEVPTVSRSANVAIAPKQENTEIQDVNTRLIIQALERSNNQGILLEKLLKESLQSKASVSAHAALITAHNEDISSLKKENEKLKNKLDKLVKDLGGI